MADISTGELPPSKVRDEVIREAKRLEERTRDSSKGHHCAAEGWNRRGVQLGIPALIISAITSAAVFTQAAKDLWWLGIAAGVSSVVVTVLTTLTTFLSPNEKENAHLAAANSFDRLNNTRECFHPSSAGVPIPRRRS
jgi:conflict system pore-forming effector with SLATT domain